MSKQPEEIKPEEQPVIAEETQPVAEEQPKVEEPQPDKSSALTALLDMLKSSKPKRELTLADRHLSSHYMIDDLRDEPAMDVMAHSYWIVKENMALEPKLTLDKIIEMGERCPCPKHTSAKAIAEFIKMNWIGEA